jgi:hypothetical protein
MRSHSCLCVPPIVARQRAVCVPPNGFSFYMWSVSYQRKVCDQLFPELLVFIVNDALISSHYIASNG